MTAAELATIVGGELNAVAEPDAVIDGTVEFDSRAVAPGGIFLALPGERVDGHDYVKAAHERGVAISIVSTPVDFPAVLVTPRTTPGATGNAAMALKADHTGGGAAVLQALAALARHSVDVLRRNHGLTVVGVTGSAGKTSTKDLIAAVLETAGDVVAPPGSFNNEIGHPWTALRANENTKFLVLELSARAPGNIADLAAIAPLDIGVVLNVGTAHLGQFGSREVIAQTKGELVEALPSANNGGVAVLNIDDPAVAAMAPRTTAKICAIGTGDDADVAASKVTLDALVRPSFVLTNGVASAEVQLRVHGEHQVTNALAAAAVGLHCGIELGDVAAALSRAQAASERRMDVQTAANGVVVINDSYNANPDSTRAALKSLATMARSSNPPRRTWAVLGEMGELGEDSIIEHDLIGRYAVRLGISTVVVVGHGRSQRALFQGAVLEGSWGEEARHVADAGEAAALLDRELCENDLILVKASKSVQLWEVAEHVLHADRVTSGRDISIQRRDERTL